jgi:hypothetical protein
MNHPTERPGSEAPLPVPDGLLSPGLRRDLADLNAQYLALGLTAGAEADPRFDWPEPVRDCLRSVHSETRARLVSVPFALFELAIPAAPLNAPATRIEDGRAVARAGVPPGRSESFAHQAVFLARRLVECGDVVSGVVFSLAPDARRWLLECRPSQLADLALDPATIRPRWRTHAQFWQVLVGAASRSSAAALQWAHCIGLCLIGAGDVPPEHAARRRPRG